MKTVILCGGMGTRLREETDFKPKPLVEIGGKPILWHIMKHYSCYGYNEFILALGYKGNIIRDYFLNFNLYNSDLTIDLAASGSVEIHNNNAEENWKVTLVETGIDSMTAYRLRKCKSFITDDKFMLTYGDAVADVDIGKLVNFNNRMNTTGTVTGVYPPSRFGDLEINKGKVISFKQQTKDVLNQKPINGGYFVFKRDFLDILPDDPSCDLEGLPMKLLVEKGELSVYEHKDFWQCMDTYRDYIYLNKLWNENPVWKLWD
ncbi:MAG: glucose-1-phosphate cytidylyltransferase [Bacteroidales bacterium]|jgi:glucose-1-phosphate cytidylyltransferase|nr:glucose-1-phosphate cytidylyltransferase [Bacteroidales bacterium]